MKVYTLTICEEKDFIIISPVIVGNLIHQIRYSANPNRVIPVEHIIPPEYTHYLLHVLNTNRDHDKFHFNQISDSLIKKHHIYEIAEYQMNGLQHEKTKCFKNLFLQKEETNTKYIYNMMIEHTFYFKCKDKNSTFMYKHPNKNTEVILSE